MPLPDIRPLRTPSAGAITPADLDRMLHVWQSRLTGGRSPSTVGLAFLDWAAHAANAPFQGPCFGIFFAAGLKHIRTKPYTPKTNGKAERFIQTALREWAYARAYNIRTHRRAAAMASPLQLAQASWQYRRKATHQPPWPDRG
jgi:transposase InsO family protein